MSKYVGFKIGKVHESSHIISEYYCGGCGWPVTDHDSFCPECGGAFHECDADNFEEENAKLRKLVRYWSEVVRLTYVYYENAEKLASKMSVIRQMMEELGIEVD